MVLKNKYSKIYFQRKIKIILLKITTNQTEVITSSLLGDFIKEINVKLIFLLGKTDGNNKIVYENRELRKYKWNKITEDKSNSCHDEELKSERNQSENIIF